MATVDELVIGLGAQDHGAIVALGKIIELLDRIADATDGNSKALTGMATTSGKTGSAVEKSARGTLESNKKLDEAGKKTVDIFKQLQKTVLGFLSAAALFSFGKKMITDVVKTDMALGSLSRTANRNIKDVEGLQNAWKAAGKDGNLAAQALQEWSNAEQEYKNRGGLNHRLQTAAFNINNLKTDPIFDERGQFRKYEDVLKILGEQAIKNNGGDEKAATQYLIGKGLRNDEAEMAVHYRNLIDKYKSQSTATDESAAAAERANQAYQEMIQRIEKLERELVMRLMPYIEMFLNWLIKLAEELSRDPDLIWDIVVALGACALAFGAIFNPIGTVISLVIGLSAVLYTATDRFKNVRLAWHGLMWAFKSGWNGVLTAIAKVASILGFDNFAKNLESYKADTDAENDEMERIRNERPFGSGGSSSGIGLTGGSGGYQPASGGGYDSSVANTVDKNGAAGIITQVAGQMGVDAGTMLNIASAESGLNTAAKSKFGSAGGLFQFVDSTWKDIVTHEGRQYGLTMSGRYDARQASIGMGIIMNRYKNALTKAGFPVNAENMYWCHFLGINGGIRFLRALSSNPNMLVQNYFSADLIRKNPAYLKVGNTLAQTYALVTGKVNSRNASALANRFGAGGGGGGLFGAVSSGITDSHRSIYGNANRKKPARNSGGFSSSNVSGNGFDVPEYDDASLDYGFLNGFGVDMDGFGQSMIGNASTITNSGNTKFTSETTVHVTSKQMQAIQQAQRHAKTQGSLSRQNRTLASKKKL